MLSFHKDTKSPQFLELAVLISATRIAIKFKDLVCKWLLSFAETNKLIPEHQYGFRQIFSTTDPLARLVGDIATFLANNKRLVAILLDFKAAFDCIWHNGLLSKLLSFVRWLSDRSFQVKANNHAS